MAIIETLTVKVLGLVELQALFTALAENHQSLPAEVQQRMQDLEDACRDEDGPDVQA